MSRSRVGRPVHRAHRPYDGHLRPVGGVFEKLLKAARERKGDAKAESKAENKGDVRMIDVCDLAEYIQQSLENQTGATKLGAMRRIGREHQIEEVGEKLRSMMSWIKANKIVDKSRN